MERDRFKWLWLKGGVLIKGFCSLKRVREICAFFLSWHRPLLMAVCIAVLFFLIYQGWQTFWVSPNQLLANERVAPSWKRELTPKEWHELRNSFRQTLVQAIGGAALLFGFFFSQLGRYASPKKPSKSPKKDKLQSALTRLLSIWETKSP